MILKNTASQGVYLFASNKTSGVGQASDQANITGAISKDGAAESAFATANPTNIGGGLYWQPLSQAETNCNAFGMRWTSSTTDILIEPIFGFTDQGRIDAVMSSRAPAASALTNAMWTDARAAKLDNLDTNVGSRSTYSGGAVPVSGTVVLDASQPNYAPAKAGDAMALTPAERTAIANEVESQIIDETDSEKVLTAITNKIAAVNPDLGGLTVSAIAAGVRLNLATELDRIDTNLDVAMSTRAPASSALSNTVWTDEKADFIDASISEIASGGSTPPTAVQIRQEMDSNSSKLALITGSVAKEATLSTIIGTLDGIGAIAIGIDAKTANLPDEPAAAGDEMGTVLDSVPDPLTGPPSSWTLAQWNLFAALRLARSSKDKATGDFSIYGTDQSTVIYTMTSTDTDDVETIGAPQ